MELEKLKEIIADVLNVEVNDITEDTTFVDDLGADSLDIFQIIMGIEETFDIEIDNDDAEQISTVGDAVEQIKNATNNNKADIKRTKEPCQGLFSFFRMEFTMSKDLKELEGKIGYKFDDFTLFTKAMIHSSYANEKHLPKYECNERLEFLGDAVLELVSSEFLFHNNPKLPEGELTKTRASMVCEPALAFCARDLDLGEYLLLGKGEDATGGRKRESVTSDAMEALIGAIYLDGGFANAKEFIHRFILKDLENKKLFFDSKTILQEIVQANFKEVISYHLIGEEGPDHNKTFRVAVHIGEEEYGVGEGRTKKAAEQEAAYISILKLHEKNIK